MKTKFELKRLRSFDQTIEASFRYFRTFFKPIFRLLWQNNKILIIALFVSYFLYNYYASQMFNFNFNGTKNTVNQETTWLSVVILIVFLLLSVVFFTRYLLTVYGFMEAYEKHRDTVKIEEEVAQTVNSRFWPFIGASFFLFFIMFIVIALAGLLFFVLFSLSKGLAVFLLLVLMLPLIVYIIVLSNLYYPVYFFEKTSVSQALRLAYRYLKERFWYSFGVIFVLGIVVTIISIVFNVPLYIYLMLKGFLAFKDPNAFAQSLQKDVVLSFFAVLSFAGQTLLRALSLIGSAILYFSIKEYHTAAGTIEKIQNIGKHDD